jgi:predicted RNase H-like HicB family nuclease/glutaredoxin
MSLTAVYQKVAEGYIAFIEEMPGANTQGATLEEARANLGEAVEMVMEANRYLADAQPYKFVETTMKQVLLITALLLASLSIAVAEPAKPAGPTAPPQGSGTESATRVELYVTDWCGYCKKAEAFLKSHNIRYTRYNVEEDPAAAQRKVRLGGGSGVPFAMIDGKPVSGFRQSTYEALLGTGK